MKTLIVDDDITNRMILQDSLESYGETNVAVNGEEAIRAALIAIESGVPYDLICLDIMMPGTDGHAALLAIRSLEKRYSRMINGNRSKILMTTAMSDRKHILSAINEQCDNYFMKPIDVPKLIHYLQQEKMIV